MVVINKMPFTYQNRINDHVQTNENLTSVYLQILRKVFLARFFPIGLLLAMATHSVFAAVLPEDRADILYHRYDGGGSTIHGPSILVRKEIADTVSIWGNTYVDVLSSASIDVVTSGSAYTEERVELSAGVDYLHDRTIMSLSFTNSSENDYEANTFGIGLSQEFFGDLTTLSLNYSQGNDEVKKNVRENGEIVGTEFMGDARHQRFGVSLTQILTKKLIVSANMEAVIDEGFLNNPYRQIRYRQTNSSDAGTEFEIYPDTHNSDAFAIRSMYYLWYRAALKLEWRRYSDSWQIEAKNAEIRYIHPIGKQWILEAKYRTYSQTQANFYSDLFDRQGIYDYQARDKELSAYSNTVFGLGGSYEVPKQLFSWIDKTTVNLQVDYMQFDYDNFTDIRGDNTTIYGLGNEPLYSFDATVVRLFVSIWY